MNTLTLSNFMRKTFLINCWFRNNLNNLESKSNDKKSLNNYKYILKLAVSCIPTQDSKNEESVYRNKFDNDEEKKYSRNW